MTKDTNTNEVEKPEPAGELIKEIPLDKICPSSTNPRSQLGDLSDLVASIKERGVLSPVLARPLGVSGLELVYGHRRLAAAARAGLKTIPTMVRPMSDYEALEAALIENIQREDVHPMEEAESYETLATNYSVEEIAAKVGKSKTFIYGRLKLTDLTPPARKAFFAGELSPAVALILARVPGAELQKAALDAINPPWRKTRGEKVSTHEAGRIIEHEFMLRLAAAPFKTTDAELVPGVPACSTCTKRTGNQAELFADVKSADVCTDPPCYRTKLGAHWNQLTLKAEKAGDVVLSEKEAAPKFVGAYLKHNSGLVSLSDACPLEPKKTFKSYAAKHKIPIQRTWARDAGGNIHELVRETTLNEAFKSAGKKLPTPGGARLVTPAEKRARTRDQLARETTSRALRTIVAAAGSRQKISAANLWRLLMVLVVPSCHQSPSKKVLERLGIKLASSGYDGGRTSELWKKVEQLPEGDARGAVVELLLADRLEYVPASRPAELVLAARHFHVNISNIKRQVEAEAKKKAAAKPTKKKTTRRPSSKKKVAKKVRPRKSK